MKENHPQFASDNYAGICPEALEAMLLANRSGHTPAYGDDYWTQQATDEFRRVFEIDCEVFFVFNGTAANSLALSALCQSYHSVVCAEFAHVETDECGAPEFFSNGSKLLVASTENGKLTPNSIEAVVTKRTDLHFPKPKAVTITQATEVGTVYSIEEIQTISHTCQRHNLYLHMDGARFANAVSTLGKTPAEVSWKSGVDVLCFGGTKNGMAVGEAIIFFKRALAEDFEYRCKQAGQLASKMRFLSAPWLGLLRDDVWLKHAQHANHCASLLSQKVKNIPGVKLMFPTQANGVFLEIPPQVQQHLREKGWLFYTFIGAGGVRLMCAWDMTETVINHFVEDLHQALS